jgi:hypothetical protein
MRTNDPKINPRRCIENYENILYNVNIFLGLGEEINTRGDYWSNGAWKLEGWRCRYHQYFLQLKDLTDYSLLPNGLVSMLTYFSMSGADKDYIPMFSWTNLFLAVLKLNNKVIFLTKHKTWVSIWHENEAIGWKVNQR